MIQKLPSLSLLFCECPRLFICFYVGHRLTHWIFEQQQQTRRTRRRIPPFFLSVFHFPLLLSFFSLAFSILFPFPFSLPSTNCHSDFSTWVSSPLSIELQERWLHPRSWFFILILFEFRTLFPFSNLFYPIWVHGFCVWRCMKWSNHGEEAAEEPLWFWWMLVFLSCGILLPFIKGKFPRTEGLRKFWYGYGDFGDIFGCSSFCNVLFLRTLEFNFWVLLLCPFLRWSTENSYLCSTG